MKRLIALLLLAAMLLTLFSGCTEEDVYVPTGSGLAPEEGEDPTDATGEAAQELMLVYSPEESMNPYVTYDPANRALLSLIYQGLFAVDSDYNVTPILCREYTRSVDMCSYTFYIAPATFSDGSQLTAKDVYETYSFARESDMYSGRFLHVKKLRLTEDEGVEFQLDTPMDDLPLLLDLPILKAKQLKADQPLGTGPYVLETAATGMRLRLRDNWWCDQALITTDESITLVAGEDSVQIRDLFEYSDLSMVCADPSANKYADYRSDYELWESENGVFLYLGCNMESSVFSYTAVRSALTHAIDRDRLVEDFYRGFARSATLAASPGSPYYNEGLAAQYGYDPELFRQAVADKRLTGQTVRLLVNKNDTQRLRVARRIAEMLGECGLAVEMVEESGEDYLYLLAKKEYDLYLGQTRLSPNMDLSAFFKSGGALRYGGMTNAAFYELCLKALENEGNYYNLHQEVAEDGRLCPILFQNYAIYAARGVLSELEPARDNIFYYSLGRTMGDALRVIEEPEETVSE